MLGVTALEVWTWCMIAGLCVSVLLVIDGYTKRTLFSGYSDKYVRFGLMVRVFALRLLTRIGKSAQRNKTFSGLFKLIFTVVAFATVPIYFIFLVFRESSHQIRTKTSCSTRNKYFHFSDSTHFTESINVFSNV